MPGAWHLVLLLLHNLRQEAVYLRLVVAPNSGTDLGRLVWAGRSDRSRMQGRSAVAPERRRRTLGVRVRSRVRDLAAHVVEVHPVAPPLLRRLLLVRRAGSSRTMERGCTATKGLWWQVNLQLLHTGVDAFAVRRWGCSSWHACACTRVVLTGLQVACSARATTRRAAHAPLPAGPPWYLGAAVANYVCASATSHASARVCRVLVKPMAARTDAVDRKRGRAGGVHPERVNGAGVESSYP